MEDKVKLEKIREIAYKAFSPEVSLMDDNRRSYYREQALANIFTIFEYGDALEPKREDNNEVFKNQITFDDLEEG